MSFYSKDVKKMHICGGTIFDAENHMHYPNVKKNLFSTMEDEKYNKLFYGVELEVRSKGGSGGDFAKFTKPDGTQVCYEDQIVDDLDGMCIFKPDCHFEITTIPATLRFHKEKLWNNFFKNTAKFTAGGVGVGLHIHFSRAALSKTQLIDFIKFMHNIDNVAFLEDIAFRQIKTGRGTTEDYSKSNAWTSMRQELTTKADDDTVERFMHGRYTAGISSRNPDSSTCEVRIFQSIPTERGLFQALEFVDALILYCKDHGRKEEELEFESFLDWFENTASKAYPYLNKNLVKLKYIAKASNTARTIMSKFRVIPAVKQVDTTPVSAVRVSDAA